MGAMTMPYERFDDLLGGKLDDASGSHAGESEDTDWTMGDIRTSGQDDIPTLLDIEQGNVNGNVIKPTSEVDTIDPFDVGVSVNGQIQYIPDGKDMQLSKLT